jgi:cytochrome b6-f complex iron-sulfur subunit
MADKDSLSVEEILAACRRLDGGDAGAAAAPQPPEASEPAQEAPPAPAPAAEEKAPAKAAPVSAGKSPKEMSVADILAAARGEKAGGGAGPAAESPAAEKAAPAKPAAPAKKPGEMSVADVLAAARGQKAAPAPAEKSSPKPAPAPKPAAKEAPKKAPAGPKQPVALDTQSILAAARKSGKRGPMTKEEAKAKIAVAEKPARPVKPKLTPPPMPEKPVYARRPQPAPAATVQEDRRTFFSSALGVFFGSSLAVGFTTLTLTNLLWLLGLARFMFPNILTEPPTRFKVGFPDEYAPGQVETKYLPQFGVWIVRYQYEGQAQIYALKSVCTHLGCTPNWLDAEQKFKCPCHGSGFYKDGINFEGPAPRPLERYAIQVADDGQLEVDKSQTFQEELGQWANPASYVLA